MKRFKLLKRKSERWVSNNRVLLGSAKKDPGRNPNFDTEETRLLISLWGDPTLQRTLITTHRKHAVIAKLAEKMGEYGYMRSAEEINTRIKNLKCFYNRLKKDIETGVITGATWKHFTAMDEIMTRSIFSVRPNEIPKPSLRYQLEIEQTEQEERKKLNASVLEETLSSSSSGTSNDDLSENHTAQTNCEESVFMDYMENVDNAVKIKEEVEDGSDSFNRDIEETPLIIPKEEPVDVEDELMSITNEITNNSGYLAPRISDYMQMANKNTSSIVKPSSCLNLPNSNLKNTLQPSPAPTVKTGMAQSILFANQPNSANQLPQGKISLVPANFLLQQNNGQTQQIQIRQQPQQRIICSQSNSQTTSGLVTSAGAGRMKVLLVNTFQNGKTSNASVAKDVSGLITSANVHKTNTPETTVLHNSTDAPKQLRSEEVTNSSPVLEMLFNKLIAMQSENNDIQKQRLEIERQRLEFEKSIADKLIEAITSIKQVQKSENTSAIQTNEQTIANTEQSIQEKTNKPELIDGEGFQLLTPKIEKIN